MVSEYADADAAWNAVIDDPSLMVADAFFLQGGGGPPEENVKVGDTVEVRDPTTGEVTERTVAAIAAAGQTLTAWMSEESATEAAVQVTPTRLYVAVDEDADPTAVALRLQGEFITNGLQADSFRDIAVEATRVNTQFFRLMQGFRASAWWSASPDWASSWCALYGSVAARSGCCAASASRPARYAAPSCSRAASWRSKAC